MKLNNENSQLNNSEKWTRVITKNNQKKNTFTYCKDINKNHKKILCQNITNNGECCYGDKCDYAHKLEDQNLDKHRKNAYSLLISENDLSEIDLTKNSELYKTLLELTRSCEECIKKKCTGGYNCKYGACLQKYQICINDLQYGNCQNKNNCAIHLSKRGLKPYFQPAKQTIISESINNIESEKIIGTLLSQDFFKKLNIETEDDDFNIDIDLNIESSDDDEINECKLSIFS
jgi:hypothetical protein